VIFRFVDICGIGEHHCLKNETNKSSLTPLLCFIVVPVPRQEKCSVVEPVPSQGSVLL
jgi:hypothetical protein